MTINQVLGINSHTREEPFITQEALAKWLKAIVVILTLFISVLCFAILPNLSFSAIRDHRLASHSLPIVFAFFWATAVPVYWAMVQCWGMFCDIGKDRSFTRLNAKRLSTIGSLAMVDGILYIVAIIGMPLLGLLTSLRLLAFSAIALVAMAIAVVSFALAHLVEKATRLQEDNNLTV